MGPFGGLGNDCGAGNQGSCGGISSSHVWTGKGGRLLLFMGLCANMKTPRRVHWAVGTEQRTVRRTSRFLSPVISTRLRRSVDALNKATVMLMPT